MVGKVFNAEKSERAIWEYLYADSNNAQGQAAKEGNLKGRIVFEKQDGEEFLAFKYMPVTIRTWLSLPGFHEIVDLCDQNHIVVQGLARKIEELNRQSCFGKIKPDVIKRFKEREILQSFEDAVSSVLEGRNFSALNSFDLQDPLFKDLLQEKVSHLLMSLARSTESKEYFAVKLIPFCPLKSLENKTKNGEMLIQLFCKRSWTLVLQEIKEQFKKENKLNELRELLSESISPPEQAFHDGDLALAYFLIVDIGVQATHAQLKRLISYFQRKYDAIALLHKPQESLQRLMEIGALSYEVRTKITRLNNLLRNNGA